VIDSLLTTPKLERSPVGYHYCDYADKRTLEPTTILGTIIRSLLEDVEIPSGIAKLIFDYYRDGERIPETKDVLDILSKTIELFKNVILVIDGIDEVKEEDRQSTYDALKCLTRIRRVPVKVFISCREDIDLALGSIPGSNFRVQISEKVISTDIDGYIRHSVAFLLGRGDLVVRNPELEQDIVEALVNGAKGMFLWVKFQLDDLCTAESDSAIKKTLLNLPKDLGETYDRLLGRIVGAERQELVKRIFRWIICARRPLHVDELCEGIAFTIDDEYWDEDKIPTDVLRLVRACGSLVVIDEESQTVELAHYTVQQYILDKQASKEKFFHFNRAEADELLGEVCVAYLNFSDFETKITAYASNNVTAAMTVMEKAFSNPEMAIRNKSPLDAMILFTRMTHHQTKGTNIDYNKHIIRKTKPIEHLLDNFRLLGYVKENWLWHTARFLPTDGAKTRRDTLFHDLVLEKQLPFDFKPWRSNANTNTKHPYLEPVGWALATNHCPLILTISKKDPTFDLSPLFTYAGKWVFEDKSRTYISPSNLERIENCIQDTWDPKSVFGQAWLYSRILTACRRGNIDILSLCIPQLLHSTSNTPKARRQKYLTDYPWFNIRGHLIIEAAASDQQTIVDWLLPQGRYADPDARCKSFTAVHDGLLCNALERAALAGHAEMVRYLRNQGWKAPGLLSGNAISGIRRLNKAVNEGNSRVLAALLEMFQNNGRPLGIIRLEEAKEDVLIRAASNGDLAVIQECIKHGLDPSKPDQRGTSAYFEAIRSGQHEVVNFLISADVGCGVEATAEGLPLSVAASVGNLQIAEVLVAHGARDLSPSTIAEDLAVINATLHPFERPRSPHPLYVAAVNGHKSMVAYFLGLGAGPNTISPTDLFPIPQASGVRATRRRTFLPDRLPDGIKSETIVPLWQRPLAGAVMTGHIEIVQLLVEAGADLNAQDTNFEFDSALFDSPFPKAVGDYGNFSPYTPLLMAFDRGFLSIAKVLLRAGANMEATDKNGRTALIWAVMNGNKRAAATLINGGASLRAEDSNGRRILEIAVEDRLLDLVECLVDLHDQTMEETPPRFLFTSRDSGEAIRNAMSTYQGVLFSKAIDKLHQHFTKAREFQIRHQQGRISELTRAWKRSEPTSPEDEEPYALEIKSQGNTIVYTVPGSRETGMESIEMRKEWQHDFRVTGRGFRWERELPDKYCVENTTGSSTLTTLNPRYSGKFSKYVNEKAVGV